MNRAVFLDRDGVINRKAPEGHYVTSWKDLELLPEACDGVRLLNASGFLVLVVTNQRCVAKGLITAAELELLHARLRDKFESAGATIDGIYYCPHDIQTQCSCRKPRPGLLLCAAAKHDVDLAVSWMIGDSNSDIEAGWRAGCHTAWVSRNDEGEAINADIIAPSLLHATNRILEAEACSVRARWDTLHDK